MITKKRLLLAIASDIAEEIKVDNYKAMRAAEAALQSLGLHVVSPLLDVLDYDARPLFRERVVNEVRDLLVKEEPPPTVEDDTPKSMRVRDE